MEWETARKRGAALLFLLVALATQACQKQPGSPQPPPPPPPEHSAPDASIHLTMGNPSAATDDEKNSDNYLMRKPYFALSYNNGRGGPNWVSWCLRDSDLGPGDRTEFFPDTSLPKSFKRVTPRDYTNSGFDRGHLCPRSDRTATQEMADATFVMSNIVPQSPHLNQRAWADLEDYTRTLAKKKQAIYIVAGVHGVGGEGTNGRADVIAAGKATVPAKCWKVMVAVENGTGGAADIDKVNPATRVIAVVMPNDQSIGHDWPKYRTSVKEVENLTGYRFFDRVPPAVIEPLKTKRDDVRIDPAGATKSGD